MKWLPVSLGIAMALVLALGLGLVLKENLQVAPWAKHATEGRRHPHLKNLTRFGGSPEDVRRQVQRAVYLDAQPRGPVSTNWTEAVQAEIQPLRAPNYVLVLPGGGQTELAWALPGLYWAHYARCPVLFTGRDILATQAERVLQELRVPAFVFAPSSLISDRVLAAIRGIVPVERVGADDLVEHAIAVAEYRHPRLDVGWGRVFHEREGYFDFVITTPLEAEHALVALPLARANAGTLLYANPDGSVPGRLDRYLWQQRPGWFVTPSEGPFRHLWVVGDRLTYASQARLDFAIEKAPYESDGPTALGPLEGLLLVFLGLGVAGGIFVLVHGLKLLPMVPLPMRVAWAFTAMLVPVLGVILYFAAYRRQPRAPGQMPAKFVRPPSIESAAATAMGFGYGAPLMIVIGWLFVYFGLPLFYGGWMAGPAFLLGSGMVLMMVAMWAGAILIAWLGAQWPMARAQMPQMQTGKLARQTLLSTALSMSAVSLGMMSVAWWMQMTRLRMMPHEDELLWFGAMWLASCVGFLIAWPLNYPMVRAQLKKGGL